jgi:hypothetical protein
MVETSCEKNDERINSDGDTIENIVEKGMVVAVLADDPHYDYSLLKLTIGPETIEQKCSDSWGRTFDLWFTKIVRGLYYDMVQSKPFLFKLIPRKTAACYSAAILFICAELEGDIITVPEELHLDILQSLQIHVFNK